MTLPSNGPAALVSNLPVGEEELRAMVMLMVSTTFCPNWSWLCTLITAETLPAAMVWTPVLKASLDMPSPRKVRVYCAARPLPAASFTAPAGRVRVCHDPEVRPPSGVRVRVFPLMFFVMPLAPADEVKLMPL